MNTRVVTMIVGLILALGMGGLLIAWLDADQGNGYVGLIFIAGVITGLVVVVRGARPDRD